MDLWQPKAVKEMTDFLNSFMRIKKIVLGGSVQSYSLLDIYSDVDMEIYSSDNTLFDIKELLNALTVQFYAIFGYELYHHDDRILLRICFENGWRFDLSFFFAKTKEIAIAENSIPERIENTINNFWFITHMVLIKLGRKDNLISAHLAFELCQLVIVVQMLMRDEEKKTNWHRFGNNEDVPVLHSLAHLKESDCKNVILDILFSAAEHMDKISAPFVNHYNRTEKLRDLRHHFGI